MTKVDRDLLRFVSALSTPSDLHVSSLLSLGRIGLVGLVGLVPVSQKVVRCDAKSSTLRHDEEVVWNPNRFHMESISRTLA